MPVLIEKLALFNKQLSGFIISLKKLNSKGTVKLSPKVFMTVIFRVITVIAVPSAFFAPARPFKPFADYIP